MMKETLNTNPKSYVPRVMSKMNYASQPYDFITNGNQKCISQLVQSVDGQKVLPPNGFLNYNICLTMQAQNKNSANFRDSF
jgi:hypothetical protein